MIKLVNKYNHILKKTIIGKYMGKKVNFLKCRVYGLLKIVFKYFFLNILIENRFDLFIYSIICS